TRTRHGSVVGPWLMDAEPIAFLEAEQRDLVSVIIPTYNRASAVRSAITSALRQTHPQIEVIVVDDGSTDDTKATLAAFGDSIRALHQPNAGVSAARNTALRHARGEFVAFLDSDDEWFDWKLAAQVAAMRGNPAAGLVWTDMSAVDPSGTVIHER